MITTFSQHYDAAATAGGPVLLTSSQALSAAVPSHQAMGMCALTAEGETTIFLAKQHRTRREDGLPQQLSRQFGI